MESDPRRGILFRLKNYRDLLWRFICKIFLFFRPRESSKPLIEQSGALCAIPVGPSREPLIEQESIPCKVPMDSRDFDGEEHISLCETLDRILNKGVVIGGDLTISVANVDLLYLDLRVLLTSVETMRENLCPGHPKIVN